MPRKKQLELIRERYQQTHGNKRDENDSGSNSGSLFGSSNEDTSWGEQDTKRYSEGYTGRNPTNVDGIETGQGFDRELYRGNGLDNGQTKPSRRRLNKDNEDIDQLPETEQGTAITGRQKRIRLPRLTPVRKQDGDESRTDKKSQQPLTKREADDARERLTAAYIGIFKWGDDIIRVTNGSHEFYPVWSVIDDHDIAILVSARLSASQKSGRQAAITLSIIHMWERFAVYGIVLPRIWQTYAIYGEYGFDIPMPEKMKRSKEIRRLRIVEQRKSNGYRPTETRTSDDSVENRG